MNIDLLKRLALFFILIIVQALVLNHIHLFDYATPLLYIYFVLSFRRGYPRWAMLLWSFCLGISVDIFTNTPGVAATTMTLCALLQPYWLALFTQRDTEEDFQPSIMTMGAVRYGLYAFVASMFYCFIFFLLESFTFFNWMQWLISSLAATAITFVLVMVIDNLKRA